jgi:nucleoside phosphorylase
LTLLLFPFLGELQGFLGFSGGLSESRIRGLRVLETPARPGWKLAVCGQGKVEAALSCCLLAEALKPDRALLIGSATALDSNLHPGDFVAGDECIEVDFGSQDGPSPNPPPRHRPTLDPPLPMLGMPLRIGPILSGDADRTDPGEKRKLGEEFSALAYAWEGAGFHRALARLGLPGMEIRVITETVDESRLALPDLQSRIRSFLPPLQNLVQELEQQWGIQ